MNLDFSFYLRLLSRRLPAMLFLFIVASSVGGVIALRMPPVYETSAKLLVESAQIPDDMVRSTVRVDAREQLTIIQQRLMTRANMLDVARNNRIFPDLATMSPDEIVAAMRQQTTILRSNRRQGGNLMTVKFEGEDPERVTAVMNDYVTIILEANSDFRSERVEGTMEFFEQEVNSMANALRDQGEQIVAFKSDNSDALPENLNYRMNRQALLQERISRAERDLESVLAQRENVQKVYAATGSLAPVQSKNVRLTPQQQRLNGLQAKLRDARLIYSEQNPRVRLLRTQVEALEAEITASGTDVAVQASVQDGEEAPSLLDLTLAELDSRAEGLREEIELASAEINKLQDSIERTPTIRIALDAMERDQRNIQSQYNAAVRRLSQARMGERVELSARGERITVLEPPSVPNAPARPNRAAIGGMGMMVGLGLAAGFFLLLELINTSIRRPAEITSAMQITPLATIPRFETQAGRRRRRRKQILGLVLVTVLSILFLWGVDTYVMPLEQLVGAVVRRIL